MLIGIDRYIFYQALFKVHDHCHQTAGHLLVWAVGVLETIDELTLAVIDSGTDLHFLYLKAIYSILSILTLVAIVVIGYTHYIMIFSQNRDVRKNECKLNSCLKKKKLKS